MTTHSAWILPLAVATVAAYVLHFMISNGVIQALTVLGK